MFDVVQIITCIYESTRKFLECEPSCNGEVKGPEFMFRSPRGNVPFGQDGPAQRSTLFRVQRFWKARPGYRLVYEGISAYQRKGRLP